jgi:hypothetical protein
MAQRGKKSAGAARSESPAPDAESGKRERMIREAAYYRAEKNGFKGDSVKYWLEAEKEVDGRAKRH